MRVDDYVTCEDVSYNMNTLDLKLPAGSFVKPIYISYVPKHVFEHSVWKMYEKDDKYTYCYTKYGIIPIKTSIIRKV